MLFALLVGIGVIGFFKIFGGLWFKEWDDVATMYHTREFRKKQKEQVKQKYETEKANKTFTEEYKQTISNELNNMHIQIKTAYNYESIDFNTLADNNTRKKIAYYYKVFYVKCLFENKVNERKTLVHMKDFVPEEWFTLYNNFEKSLPTPITRDKRIQLLNQYQKANGDFYNNDMYITYEEKK